MPKTRLWTRDTDIEMEGLQIDVDGKKNVLRNLTAGQSNRLLSPATMNRIRKILAIGVVCWLIAQLFSALTSAFSDGKKYRRYAFPFGGKEWPRFTYNANYKFRGPHGLSFSSYNDSWRFDDNALNWGDYVGQGKARTSFIENTPKTYTNLQDYSFMQKGEGPLYRSRQAMWEVQPSDDEIHPVNLQLQAHDEVIALLSKDVAKYNIAARNINSAARYWFDRHGIAGGQSIEWSTGILGSGEFFGPHVDMYKDIDSPGYKAPDLFKEARVEKSVFDSGRKKEYDPFKPGYVPGYIQKVFIPGQGRPSTPFFKTDSASKDGKDSTSNRADNANAKQVDANVDVDADEQEETDANAKLNDNTDTRKKPLTKRDSADASDSYPNKVQHGFQKRQARYRRPAFYGVQNPSQPVPEERENVRGHIMRHAWAFTGKDDEWQTNWLINHAREYNYFDQLPSRDQVANAPLKKQALGDLWANIIGAYQGQSLKSSLEIAVEQTVRSQPVVIFSVVSDARCRKALRIIKDMHLNPPALVVNVDERPDERNLKDLLDRKTGHNTYPNIIIGSRSIGGVTELVRLIESRDLYSMLNFLNVSYVEPHLKHSSSSNLKATGPERRNDVESSSETVAHTTDVI